MLYLSDSSLLKATDIRKGLNILKTKNLIMFLPQQNILNFHRSFTMNKKNK